MQIVYFSDWINKKFYLLLLIQQVASITKIKTQYSFKTYTHTHAIISELIKII